MLEKKYYNGMQIHDVLCECLDDYDTILTILEKFASLPSAINADRKTESNSEIPNNCEDEPKIECLEWHNKLGNYHRYPKDEPQTANLFTDKDGDVWEWRGDAWYCISGQDEPTTQTETQNSNLTFEKDECAKEYEELGLRKLKELRKDEPQTDCAWK